MRIIFLGTSSGVPTKERGLSSTALCLESEILLFDCGEGTQMQLKRAELRSSKISKVFISHMHGDHVNGLIGLLMSMDMETRSTPLDIYGPPELPRLLGSLKRYLRTSFKFETNVHASDEGLICNEADYTVTCAGLKHRVPCTGFAFHERTKPGRFDAKKAMELGIPAGPMYGAIQQGATITLPDGRSFGPDDLLGPPRPGRRVTYIIDTRPCENAVRLGYEADALIHEATFCDDLRDKAIESGHSTAREAAEIALKARAGHLLLTHFSSRYHSVKPLVKEAQKVFRETTAAQDFHEHVLPPREEAVAATAKD